MPRNIRHLQNRLYGLKQKGTALITGLVLLTVMSVVSISTLENSIVQTSLSTNAQHKAIAFQEAETALQKANSPSHLLAAMKSSDRKSTLSYKSDLGNAASSSTAGAGNAWSKTKAGGTDSKGEIEAEAAVEFCGVLPSGSVRGMSLNSDQSSNSSKKYVRYIFDVSSTVNLTKGRQTKSIHSQRSSRLMMGSSGMTDDKCV